jgi:hypothetical protein
MKKTIITAMMCLMAVIGVRAQEDITYEAWEGTLNKGKTPVQVFMEKRDDGLVAGWIRYPQAQKPEYIFLVGNAGEQEGVGQYISIYEYQKNGHQNGGMFLKVEGTTYSGTWQHLDKEIDMVLTGNIDYPEELKGQLTPATRKEIGRRYTFSYDHITGDERGGTAEFTIKGTEKLAYNISVYAPNIAEGEGVGALFNNIMTGVEEEANYEFHAEFFPRFCIITDIVGPEMGFYGAWTSFAHVYIKR